MAAMVSADRAAVAAAFNREWLTGESTSCLKADIAAAVNAVDDWVVANAVAFNNALPTAAKNNLTAALKARLLMYVVEQRYKVGA